jgi:hypothetical protein
LFSLNLKKTKNMSKTQTKPIQAYKNLDDSGRRLVNKLIIGLHDKQLPDGTKLDINRAINRSRRNPSDTGKRYTNGYLVFYKERFPQLKKTDAPVTEIAKRLGAEWNSLTEEEKDTFRKRAAEQR